jgi:shikimate dehydrogenase
LPGLKLRGPALAVIGHPIKHSLSPPMHRAALAGLAKKDTRFAAWDYLRFDIPPDELAAALPRLHATGFHGLNLTVPHKVLAFGQVEAVDSAAQAIGAVNTLHRTPTGWRGHNTDGFGLAAALREDLGVQLAGTPVILLGAGGAARAAAVECLRQRCAALWIGNRTAGNLATLLESLRPHSDGVPLHGFDLANPPAGLPANAVLINATSAGLKVDDPAPIALRRLPAGLSVFDMIYNPPVTPLLRDVAALGWPHANGLGMLVHQGAQALRIWTGTEPDVPAMRAAATAALGAA